MSIEPTSGLNAVINPLIEAFITKKATAPAKPAVPLSFLANPIASPIHIIRARLAKITSPEADITCKIPCRIGIFKKG